MSLTAILAVILPSTLVAAFLSGIFGMAGGLILMGVLLLVLPVAQAMMLHGAIQAVSNGWRALVWWRHIHFSLIPAYALGTLAVAGLMSLVRFVPDKSLCYLLMGVIPAISVLLPAHRVPSIRNKPAAFAGGVVITALQLTAGASGPVIDAMYLSSGLGRREIVASKAFSVCWSHLIKFLYFATVWRLTIADEVDLPVWLYAAALAMAMAGTTLSRTVLERMSDTNFLKWSRWIVLSVSAVYVVRGLAGMLGLGIR
jgi:uncharacterized membrane protein YfcA